MESDRVVVRKIEGRYPANAGRFDGESIQTTCTREAQVVRVRIDDPDNDEFWMELLIEIED